MKILGEEIERVLKQFKQGHIDTHQAAVLIVHVFEEAHETMHDHEAHNVILTSPDAVSEFFKTLKIEP